MRYRGMELQTYTIQPQARFVNIQPLENVSATEAEGNRNGNRAQRGVFPS